MPALPIPRPHTTLSSYADKMGINPLHFFGGHAPGLFQLSGSCSNTWHRHTWQDDDNVSHEDLAYQLINAERDMMEIFGFPVFPQWIELSMPYPNPRTGMYDKYGGYKTLSTQVGYVHAGGKRAVEVVSSGLAVTYSDEDGDSFEETATIDISGLDQTGWFDNYGKILVVPSGYTEEFSIDTYASIDSTKIVAHTWVMIDPEIASRFPTNDLLRIDLMDNANLIQTVDLHRVYNDTTGACTFLWEDGTTQTGSLLVVDDAAGVVRPSPASGTWCTGTAPFKVNISIYAGHQPDLFMVHYSDFELGRLDPLIGEAIRLMATARLERDLCGCSNVVALGKDLREDMALVSPQGNFLAVADVIQECPFGTRRGEWLAWNKVKNFTDKYISVALV